MPDRLVLSVAAALALVGCPSEPEPDPEPTPEPTPAPLCLDVPAGDSEDCPAVSCRTIAEDRPDALDGDYWLDGGLGMTSALATCDLTGGGWLEVVFEDADGVLVAENNEGNPWHKCDDDAAAPYAHVASEDVVTPDWSSGNIVWTVDLRWTRPDGGEPYGPLELAALRAGDAIAKRSFDARCHTDHIALRIDNTEVAGRRQLR